MHIAYYVTGHGFGHAIRSAIIAGSFSPSVRLTFRTSVSEAFFHRELERPFSYEYGEFDCGCIQSDSISVDVEKTLSRYDEIARKNSDALLGEVEWCRKSRVDGIVSDIVPFAFEVAGAAGIPSAAVTNFTWYDIYSEYVETVPSFLSCLEMMRRQYMAAHLLLRLYPSLPMDYFSLQRDMPPVGRRGVDRREALVRRHRIEKTGKLALIYIGDFGLPQVNWTDLEQLSGWDFFGLQQLPGAPGNYHVIAPDTFYYPDLIASVDCAVGKLGYGMVSECLINGTPLLFLPRRNFAEYPVLEKAVLSNDAGIGISPESFFSLDWGAPLNRCTDMRPSVRQQIY